MIVVVGETPRIRVGIDDRHQVAVAVDGDLRAPLVRVGDRAEVSAGVIGERGGSAERIGDGGQPAGAWMVRERDRVAVAIDLRDLEALGVEGDSRPAAESPLVARRGPAQTREIAARRGVAALALEGEGVYVAVAAGDRDLFVLVGEAIMADHAPAHAHRPGVLRRAAKENHAGVRAGETHVFVGDYAGASDGRAAEFGHGGELGLVFVGQGQRIAVMSLSQFAAEPVASVPAVVEEHRAFDGCEVAFDPPAADFGGEAHPLGHQRAGIADVVAQAQERIGRDAVRVVLERDRPPRIQRAVGWDGVVDRQVPVEHADL